jgi:hypothetical protein
MPFVNKYFGSNSFYKQSNSEEFKPLKIEMNKLLKQTSWKINSFQLKNFFIWVKNLKVKLWTQSRTSKIWDINCIRESLRFKSGPKIYLELLTFIKPLHVHSSSILSFNSYLTMLTSKKIKKSRESHSKSDFLKQTSWN